MIRYRLPTPPTPEHTEVIRPQDGPQTAFLRETADVVIYGGAAGGGKTWALLLDAAYYAAFKPVRDYSAVIFRRTAPQIKMPGGLWAESKRLYPLIGGKPNKTDFTWEWPQNGTSVKFAHMQFDDNMYDWQGSQTAYVAFDELTHFGEGAFFYLLSRLRSTCGVRPRLRGTVNPDPDSWVKTFLAPWVDDDHPWHAEAGQVLRFYRENDVTYWLRPDDPIPAHIKPEHIKTGTFIPAKLSDNPALTRADPSYEGNLMALPLVERERLLGGPLAWKIRAEGNLFRREWFSIVDAAPAELERMVRRWDLAGTEPRPGHNDPDYTVGAKWGRTAAGVYYVLDVVRGQWSPKGVEDVIVQTAALDGPDVPIRIEQEPGSSGKAVIDRLVTLLDGYDVQGERSTGDKVTRAGPVSAQAQAGNVKLIRGAWNLAWLNEHCAFPNPRVHDDQVDTSSGAHGDLSARRMIPLADEPDPVAGPEAEQRLIDAIHEAQKDPFAWADRHNLW